MNVVVHKQTGSADISETDLQTFLQICDKYSVQTFQYLTYPQSAYSNFMCNGPMANKEKRERKSVW